MNAPLFRLLVFTLAPLALALSVQAQTFYGIIKTQQFVQNSAAVPRLAATDSARFAVLIPANTPGELRHPSGSISPLAVNASFERRFATLEDLDAAFPAGTYGMTLGSAGDVALIMPANPYPSTVPEVMAGNWSPTGDLLVDPTRSYTLSFNLFTGYATAGAQGSILITVSSLTGQVISERQVFNSQTPVAISSHILPAGTLVAGRRYSVEIQFLTVDSLNLTALPGAFGIVGGMFATQFFIQAAAPVTAPAFVTQPVSQTIGTGSTVVFSVQASGSPAPTYQWRRGTTILPGETRPTLVLSGAAAVAGVYSCVLANDGGTVTSNDAVLTVNNVSPTALGRLVNLSVMAPTGPGTRLLTMGATVGGQGAAGPLPLVIRGIGPSLSSFGVTGVLADPVLSIFPAGSTVATSTNDNWGGTATLAAAFTRVAAFELPARSLDSAALQNQAAGGLTVQVAGKGTAAGTVIAEVYDAAGSDRTATTPRLTNLSTLTSIARGTTLSVGFVIGGTTARSVLVRAVGPTLGTAFGLTGVMTDPTLELFNNDRGVQIAANDNWAGSTWLLAANGAVGAFPLGGPGTRDAALLITLPPGAYSARVTGASNSSGTAIIEVYEVP